MQRDVSSFVKDPEGFIARYKRPYEEAMGRTRSADDQTMREAARSYILCDSKTNVICIFSS
ncbi:hypothetical protein V1523DRAFT_412300 [Lipomyces doorenjongii]